MTKVRNEIKNACQNDDFTLATAPLEVVFQRIADGLPGGEDPQWVKDTVTSLLARNSEEVRS